MFDAVHCECGRVLVDLSDSDAWIREHRLRCSACGREFDVCIDADLFPTGGGEPRLEVSVAKTMRIPDTYLEDYPAWRDPTRMTV